MTRNTLSGGGRLARRSSALRVAAAIVVGLGGWGSGAASGQIPDVGVIRITESDGRFRTSAPLTREDPYWFQFDTLVDPRKPDRGTRGRVAEQLVYEIISGMTGPGDGPAKAEQAARELVAFVPERPAAHYNLACVLASRGKINEALDAYEKAIALGWRHERHTSMDGSLDPLRSHPRFAALTERMTRLVAEEAVTPRPIRTDAWQTAVGDLEREAPAILARHHVPGASIALVSDGRVVWTGAFGRKDERSDERLSMGTLFRVDGPARLLTAIVAMQLHERQAWSLDDPLSKWTSALRFGSLDFARDVTIRRALNHTAGLAARRLTEPAEGVDDEINRTIVLDPSRVGVKYTWAPEAYLAVGRAVEKALANPDTADQRESDEFDGYFGERVRAGVLTPLRMNATRTGYVTRERFDVATGHSEYGTPYLAAMEPRKPASPIFTTAGDLGLLLEFMLGSHADGVRPVLTIESIASMHAPGLEHPALAGWHFGLGIEVRETEFGRCAQVSSVRQGVGCLMRWYPDSKCGVVILFNADTGLPAAERLANLALGGI